MLYHRRRSPTLQALSSFAALGCSVPPRMRRLGGSGKRALLRPAPDVAPAPHAVCSQMSPRLVWTPTHPTKSCAL